MIRALSSAGLRAVAVACCVGIALAGCHHRGAVRGADVGSLIVSLDDVRRIADLPELDQYAQGDADRPAPQRSDAPTPCRSAYDQDAVFGSAWNQFRTVTYTALVGTAPAAPRKMYVVTQAVGIYPDDTAARAAFDRLAPALAACSALQLKYYDFTVNRRDAATVTLDYPKGEAQVVYRAKSAALIDVVVQGFPQSERIAATVLQEIADRIA